ncbi:MAG: glycosyltransferase involved in cell wall biosynthesis [Bacteroidia bacterium]|jgi:glycosyltransferase involved in cell wall biosynthesis
MRIAVNTRLLLPGRLEGIGRFTNETLKILVADHPEVEWIFLFDRPFDQQFIFGPNVTPVVVWPQARHPLLWTLWFGYMVPRVLKKHNVDLFLSPDGYNSLNAEMPTVDVIHDLNFEHNPDDVPGWAGRYLRSHFPKFAKASKRVATVSEYSKRDIEKTYGIDSSKIDVVYNGVDARFAPSSIDQRVNIRNREAGDKPFFLYVGSINPRKNIERMLQAFDQFKSENTSREHKLIVAGAKMVWTDKMESTFDSMRFKSDVLFKGKVSDTTLGELLGAAEALVYVSYFEGFGIPVIEAFQAELPVICSSVTSLPEVAGDAALLIDPYDVNSITNAMASIANNPKLRLDLIQKGNARNGVFTWQRTADLLWQSIQKAL